MVTAGHHARAAGLAYASCPYSAPDDVEYWHLGWTTHDGALRRWERQADQVNATLRAAELYLDRDKLTRAIPLSKVIALHFYVLASTTPDAAYEWFQRTIKLARDKHRQQEMC